MAIGKIWVRLDFLGEDSEKGNTRNSTENRVARCSSCFWGNLRDLRCFTKRIGEGEILVWTFLRFVRCST
jgi:hypothetical protein